MEIINVGNIKTENKFKPHRVIKKDDVAVVILPFSPGQGLPIHTTPVDVFFYVIEGKAEITIGEEKKVVPAGNIVLSPANIPHTVKNNSNGDVKVMVVKTPNPDRLKP